MCGRVAVTSLKGRIAELVAFLEIQQGYNVAPTGQLVTVQAGWEPRMRRWGLIPSWAKDGVIAAKTFNARGETVAEKPAFRAAFRQRRCLIPVAGFYEWASTGKTKTPFYISNANPDEMLVFAGLWERWKEVETCTIITTEANAWMQELHTRMPVILGHDSWEAWIDPRTSQASLQALLQPPPDDSLQAWQVRPLLGDGPELIEPA